MKKLTDKQIKEAIDIIINSNNINVSFNVPVDNHYSNVHKILILESNASVINKLIEAGFSLSMTKKGLAVDEH